MFFLLPHFHHFHTHHKGHQSHQFPAAEFVDRKCSETATPLPMNLERTFYAEKPISSMHFVLPALGKKITPKASKFIRKVHGW